jgi:hypothetical protein
VRAIDREIGRERELNNLQRVDARMSSELTSTSAKMDGGTSGEAAVDKVDQVGQELASVVPPAATHATQSCLVVFDFDWTVIDTNSDTWVLEQLSPKVAAFVKEQRGTIQ